MQEVIEVWYLQSPTSCMKRASLTSTVSWHLGQVNVGCILGHAWPVVTLPLHEPVKAYVVDSASRAVNILKFPSSDIARTKIPPLPR